MIDLLEAFCQTILASVIVGFLTLVCFVLLLLSIVFYPVKIVRIWFAQQSILIVNTADFYLDSVRDKDD